jgi:hypothetical protein
MADTNEKLDEDEKFVALKSASAGDKFSLTSRAALMQVRCFSELFALVTARVKRKELKIMLSDCEAAAFCL